MELRHMAEASAAVGRRKASALRSARAASDDAAHSFAPFCALPPLIFLEANTSCRSLPKLGCAGIARTSSLFFPPRGRGGGGPTGARAASNRWWGGRRTRSFVFVAEDSLWKK